MNYFKKLFRFFIRYISIKSRHVGLELCCWLLNASRLTLVREITSSWAVRNPDDVDFQLLDGMAAYQAGDHEACLKRFQEILEMEPSHARAESALLEMAHSYSIKKEFEKAIDILKLFRAQSAANPEVYIRLGDYRRQLEDQDGALAAYEKGLEHDRDNAVLIGKIRVQKILKIPGIFLCTLPKSGSVFIHQALCRGLNKKPFHMGAGGYFPNVAIPMESINQIKETGAVYLIHCEASQYNKIELSQRQDKIIVHVRDPRQALISWTHYCPQVVSHDDPVQAIHYGLPDGFVSWPFEKQLNWQLENFYEKFVDWITGWVEAESDPDFKTEILFTTQEELNRDMPGFFRNIFDFLNIDPDLFEFPPLPVRGEQNFRKGLPDEWRNVLDASQSKSVSHMIPENLYMKFGWNK